MSRYDDGSHMKKPVYALFALAAALFLGACDKQSFDETRQLQPSHGHAADGHGDEAKNSHDAKSADSHGEKKPAH